MTRPLPCTYTTTIEVEIDYTFTPGTPERGPSYASGGEPAEGPEIDVQQVWLTDGNGKRLIDITSHIGHEILVGLLGQDFEDNLGQHGQEAFDDARDAAMDARAEARRDDCDTTPGFEP